jgi:hypothetical protein
MKNKKKTTAKSKGKKLKANRQRLKDLNAEDRNIKGGVRPDTKTLTAVTC